MRAQAELDQLKSERALRAEHLSSSAGGAAAPDAAAAAAPALSARTQRSALSSQPSDAAVGVAVGAAAAAAAASPARVAELEAQLEELRYELRQARNSERSNQESLRAEASALAAEKERAQRQQAQLQDEVWCAVFRPPEALLPLPLLLRFGHSSGDDLSGRWVCAVPQGAESLPPCDLGFLVGKNDCVCVALCAPLA